MGRVRADAVGLQHLLGVAVVGGDEADAAERGGRLDDPPEGRVGRLDGAHDGGDHARVADHVGVREVDDAEAVALAAARATTSSATPAADISGFRS